MPKDLTQRARAQKIVVTENPTIRPRRALIALQEICIRTDINLVSDVLKPGPALSMGLYNRRSLIGAGVVRNQDFHRTIVGNLL
jgi:hypothetical protein